MEYSLHEAFREVFSPRQIIVHQETLNPEIPSQQLRFKQVHALVYRAVNGEIIKARKFTNIMGSNRQTATRWIAGVEEYFNTLATT
jgi:hypothetical protein